MSAMVARRSACRAGRATFTTVPSMNAMLEPRMVAARIQGPFVVAWRSHGLARIAASSQGGLAMLAMIYCPLGAGSPKLRSADPDCDATWLGRLRFDVKGLGASQFV